MNSFRRKDEKDGDDGVGGGGRTNLRGQRRKNETHESRTDPGSRWFRKGPGKEARLVYMGHVLMENRNGLVVDSRLTSATGKAEREVAQQMIGRRAGGQRLTLGADRAMTPRTS